MVDCQVWGWGGRGVEETGQFHTTGIQKDTELCYEHLILNSSTPICLHLCKETKSICLQYIHSQHCVLQPSSQEEMLAFYISANERAVEMCDVV